MAAQKRKGWHPVALTSPKHEIDCGDKGPIAETIETIVYHRSGEIGTSLPGIHEVWLMLRLYGRMKDLIASFKPDIIQAHSPLLNVIPAIVCGIVFNIPVVYEIRAFWEDAGADQGTYKVGSPKYRLVRNLETLCCRLANHVTVICRGLKEDLTARGLPEDKISIIYNAVHPEDFAGAQTDSEYARRWKIDKRTKVVGFIGSFYDYEGLDVLLRAFADVVAARDDTILVLVGGGERVESLRRMVENLGLSDWVRMPGRIPLRRVPGAYALIDLLVYPRKSVRLTELVTPLKPLEAMAMGKALVASDIGGHRELIVDGETGVLVTPEDPKALAHAIHCLLADDDLRADLGDRGIRRVRSRFTWDATTEPYANIYARLRSTSIVSGGSLLQKAACRHNGRHRH